MGAMQPERFEVERGGRFATVRTCGGPVGAACGLFPDLRPPSWRVVGGVVVVVDGRGRGDVSVRRLL